MDTVHNFSYGLLNPGLAYATSCRGAFLGLRCVTIARVYEGRAKARWLVMAAVSLGAIGIWTMHFVAMLGFSVPGETIRYNVPVTVGSMLLAVVVVGVGLFIVGYAPADSPLGGWPHLVAGGVIVGLGVAAMHYMGMAGMSMSGSMSYSLPLVLLSLVIAMVAGTTALWIGTWIRGVTATIEAAFVMAAAVCGMHYTAMGALRVSGGAMPNMTVSAVNDAAAVPGATAAEFLIPVLLVIGLGTFLLTLAISVSPSEDEVRTDAELQRRLEQLQRRLEQLSRRG
jgi:NO-binding membrane sensor protein with MHYT domain